MNDEVKSVLGRWVAKFHWDEVVLGTIWSNRPRGIRSIWRNGYMANQKMNDTGIRLVHGLADERRGDE